jgi:hypothetical protein
MPLIGHILKDLEKDPTKRILSKIETQKVCPAEGDHPELGLCCASVVAAVP